jgi:beta-galactosidase
MVNPCLFLLFTLLASGRDTIITDLAPPTPSAPRSAASSKRTPNSTPTAIIIRLLNTSANPLHNILLEWSLQTNGFITRKGKTTIPTLPPQYPTPIRLPLRLPDDTAGETFLLLRYHSAASLLAEQQLRLTPYCPHLTIVSTGEITQTDDNDTFTIHSPTIRISFNRQTGWLIHYEIKGIDLLDDTLGLRSNFQWPGYNDSAATPEPHLQLFSNTTSSDQIVVRTEYTLPATASLLHLSYTINADGEMLVTQQVEPDTTQPTPRQWAQPCFGMQWILPPGYDSITGYGPLPSTSSGAPDSTRIGTFHDHPTTPSSPDPHARATSTRTGIRWWTITDKDGNGLQFIADTPLLNTSALHWFDSDLITAPNHPISRPQIQISIDRTTPNTIAQPTPISIDHPVLLSMGNLRYSYKVKPLVFSKATSNRL